MREAVPTVREPLLVCQRPDCVWARRSTGQRGSAHKGQRSKSSFANLAVARKAGAVPARPEPDERFADPGQSLRSHLEQRELDFVLDVGVRRVDLIAYVVALIDSPSTDPILHLVLQFTLAFGEHLPKV